MRKLLIFTFLFISFTAFSQVTKDSTVYEQPTGMVKDTAYLNAVFAVPNQYLFVKPTRYIVTSVTYATGYKQPVQETFEILVTNREGKKRWELVPEGKETLIWAARDKYPKVK